MLGLNNPRWDQFGRLDLPATNAPASAVAWNFGCAVDALRQPEYPYSDIVASYSSNAEFLSAIEAENEVRAVALIRSALQSGIRFAQLEGPLSRAARAYYNDFWSFAHLCD